MKKYLNLATVFSIALFTMIGCSNTDKEVIFESEEPALMELGEEPNTEQEEPPMIVEEQFTMAGEHIEGNDSDVDMGKEHAKETTCYAIYPSILQEQTTDETNQYVYYKKEFSLYFPQIYYSNEYTEYDESTEQTINQMLFDLSLRNNVSIMTDRDHRDLQEYSVDYRITDINENRFSVQYHGFCETIWKAQEFCYGITIDILTGEALEVTDFITLDEQLLERIKDGEIKYTSGPGYDENIVLIETQWFLDSYNEGLLNLQNCFFLEGQTLYLILTMHQGNSNFILLEVNL